jgi:hypothetical protein
MSLKPGTIIVRCVYCKATRVLDMTKPESRKQPFCEKDGGPMVAIETTAYHYIGGGKKLQNL